MNYRKIFLKISFSNLIFPEITYYQNLKLFKLKNSKMGFPDEISLEWAPLWVHLTDNLARVTDSVNGERIRPMRCVNSVTLDLWFTIWCFLQKSLVRTELPWPHSHFQINWKSRGGVVFSFFYMLLWSLYLQATRLPSTQNNLSKRDIN